MTELQSLIRDLSGLAADAKTGDETALKILGDAAMSHWPTIQKALEELNKEQRK